MILGFIDTHKHTPQFFAHGHEIYLASFHNLVLHWEVGRHMTRRVVVVLTSTNAHLAIWKGTHSFDIA